MDRTSLLDLFEMEKANLDSRFHGNDERKPEINPFRKQLGECARCPESDTRHSTPDTRLYWCHLCGATGCWDWLIAHKDENGEARAHRR